MIYQTAKDWRAATEKRVLLFGMSGLGKTHVSKLLRDRRRLVSLFRRLPHRHALHGRTHRRQLQARGDEGAVAARLADDRQRAISPRTCTFDNLAPLSTYLGKPGDPAKGGLPFAEYLAPAGPAPVAEMAALLDTGAFHRPRARALYGYPQFRLRHRWVDLRGGGSRRSRRSDADGLVEIRLMVWIEGSEAHTRRTDPPL